MIYLYDDAICEDLRTSFNPDQLAEPVVKVIAPEAVIGLAAQIQDDRIKFPVVAVTRGQDYPIDWELSNFTRMHRGVVSVIDEKTNQLYYERAVPIDLKYSITVLTTNTADLDEIVRELIFKYTDMFFLTIKLPYEANRKVRFGVELDRSANIERSSGKVEHIQSGQLYQAIIPLVCRGCVLVHHTPAKLKRLAYEVSIDLKNRQDNLV